VPKKLRERQLAVLLRQPVESKFLLTWEIVMFRTIEENRGELTRLCAFHGVLSPSLFGSATTDRFDPEQSDLDFLVVEFKPMSPKERADHYFSLMEDLQALFGISIDLVESAPICNPFFRAAVEETRILLYDAA
jgi:hypothetical protein